MLIKDQLQVRMDQLNMPVNELARRVGVSGQSVRHWLAGRSFPGKAKCNLVEEALSFKLDFSEGNTGQTETIDKKLVQTDLAARNAISLLTPTLQVLFAKIAAEIVEIQRNAKGVNPPPPVRARQLRPEDALSGRPSSPANHGRADHARSTLPE